MKKKSITYKKYHSRLRRRVSIRKRLRGNAEVPRLAIFRSLKNITAQIINDDLGNTLVSLATNSKEFDLDKSKKKTEQSFMLGEKLGAKALAAGITAVRFDRGGFLYHGRVKAFADGARKAGLKF